MKTPEVPSDLATDFLYVTGPVQLEDGTARVHYIADSEKFLHDQLDIWNYLDGTPEQYDYKTMLVSYWADKNYDWSRFNEQENRVMWPIEVVDRADAAILMRAHAPGIALIELLDEPDGEPEAFGLTCARRSLSARGGEPMDPRDTRDTVDLRLAIAYVCCGHVPPVGLTLMALQTPLPWPIDDGIIDGLKQSIELACSTARESLVSAQSSPTP